MRRRVLFASLLLSLQACSLTGLDRFDWPSCDECDVLNTRDGIDPSDPETCELWRCDPQSNECSFGSRDEDGDQHAPIACDGDDCDDTEPTAFAGATEICNGVDDDCNGWVDDAASEPATPVAILDAPMAPRWVSSEAVSGGLLASFETAGGAGIEVVRGATAITAGQPLGLSTSSPPYTVDSASVVMGCATQVQQPALPRFTPCGAGDACPEGRICVTSAGGERLCDTLLPVTPAPDDCTTHAQCDDGVFCNGGETCSPGSSTADPVTGCRPRALAACEAGLECIEESRACARPSDSPIACAIHDASIGSVGDDEWIGAAITTATGCATGVLRLGYFSMEPPRTPESRYPVRRIVQRGDRGGLRGPGWLGVDLDANQRCPGPATGRPEGAPTGASGPAIAGLPYSAAQDRLRPQALVAYLAGPACRSLGTCPDGASRPLGADGALDVELVGVWLEEGGAGGATVGWTTVASSGAPTRLGTRTNAGITRPAVASWTSASAAGYLVAYPASGAGIAVHVVPAMSDPAPVCPATEPACEGDGDCDPGLRCLGEPTGTCQLRPCVSQFDTRPTQLGQTSRETPALTVPAATVRFAAAEVTGDVVMALGRTRASGEIELAFAWEEASAIVIASGLLDPASGMITEGAMERVDASAASELAIAHVASGIVRAGAELDGEPVSDDALGGFVITWRDGDSARALRIADVDGAVVAPGAVVIGTATTQARAFVNERNRLGALAHDGDEFVVVPAICGTPAR